MKYKVIFIVSGNEKEFVVDDDWEIASTTGSLSGLYILLKQKEQRKVKAEETPLQNSVESGYKPYEGKATCMACEAQTCRCFGRLIG